MSRPIGFGGGFRGRGRGRRNMFYATGLPGWMRYPDIPKPSKEQEIQFLEQDTRNLEEQLNQIRKRINELKGE